MAEENQDPNEGTQTETQDKSFIDLLSEETKTEPQQVEVKAVVTQPIVEAAPVKPESFLDKAEKFDVTPEDLKKIAREIAGEDYSKVDFEGLLRIDVQKTTGLVGEALEQALESTQSKYAENPYDKAIFEQSLRSKYNGSTGESETLKKYESAYVEKQKKIQEQTANLPNEDQQKQHIEDVSKEELGRIESKATSLIGTKYLIEVDGKKVAVGEFSQADVDKVKSAYSFDKSGEYFDAKSEKFQESAFIKEKYERANLNQMLINAYKAGQQASSIESATGKSGKTSAPNVAAIDAKKEQLKQRGIQFFDHSARVVTDQDF